MSAVPAPARPGADGPATVDPGPNLAYRLVFPPIKLVVGSMFRMRWLHRDRIPSGGIVMAANHVSYVDPFAIGLSLPTRRPIHYMAKIELFRVPVLGWFLRSVGMVPVNRGTADRGAIREATDILKAGGVIGIFPEGTRIRGGKVSHPEVGAAFVASLGGAVIVPAGISGTDRVMPPGRKLPRFPRVTIAVGDPIDPRSFADVPKGERMEAITAAVMAAIAAAKAEADAAGKDGAR